MALSRLDKLVAHFGAYTRSRAKELIKTGQVSVNGSTVVSANTKLDEDRDIISVNGKILSAKKYVYIMLNKPQGVLSATEDKKDKTVLELISEEYKGFGLFPVGRLDKDTVGLLILTNDGAFAHNSLSPKKHIEKRYVAYVTGNADKDAIESFGTGIKLKDFTTKPARLIIKERRNDFTVTEVVISEGKFHQIKRMFEAVGCKVIYLKRTAFGEIRLDEKLKEGEYRPLNDKELEYAKRISKGE